MTLQVRFRAPPRAPDEVAGVKIPYPVVKRHGHKLAWYLILLVVLSPILYLLLGVVGSWLSLTANGTVSLDQQEVRASQSGTVTRLDIQAGESVQAGQTVAVLDSFELAAAEARNTGDRGASASARRSAAETYAMGAEEVRIREHTVQYQRERRATLESLVRQGAATEAELGAADHAVAEAESALLQARKSLTPIALPLDREDFDSTLLKSRRGAMVHRSPLTGRVLEVMVKAGEYVSPGEPLLIVGRLDNAQVIAYTPPRFGTRLKMGTIASIRFPDGTQTLASIAALPQLTRRMPSDLVDQFGLRPMTVALNLLPQEKWPDAVRIQGLPVSVRFHYDWEDSAVGRRIGALLGWMSR